MSASFESWLSASRSTNSLESAYRSHVKQNLDRTSVTPVNRRNSARRPEPRSNLGSYNTLKPHLQKQWVIPPEANAAFVAGMEDVLEVYQRPHDPACPVVCLDEATKQLIKETRVPIPAKPSQPARHDYEYERNSLPRT